MDTGNLKTNGPGSHIPALKPAGHEDAGLAGNAFSAIMAGLASAFCSAKGWGGQPLIQGAPEAAGIEAISNAGFGRPVLLNGHLPLMGRLSGEPSQAQPESEAALHVDAMPGKNAAGVPLKLCFEQVATLFRKHIVVAGGKYEGQSLSILDVGGVMEGVESGVLEPQHGSEKGVEFGVVLEPEYGLGTGASCVPGFATHAHLGQGEPLPAVQGAMEQPVDFQAMRLLQPEARRVGCSETAISEADSNGFDMDSEPGKTQGGHEEDRVAGAALPAYSLKVRTGPGVKDQEFQASIQHPEKIAEVLADEAGSVLPKSVEFRLDPPGLGKITVVIASRGEEVCVKFVASSYGSHQMLAGSEDALAQALSERGLSLAGFFVDHGMAGQSNQPRHEFASASQTLFKHSRPDGYDGIQDQPISGGMILGSRILDYRV